jgi:hypothetical protein
MVVPIGKENLRQMGMARYHPHKGGKEEKMKVQQH